MITLLFEQAFNAEQLYSKPESGGVPVIKEAEEEKGFEEKGLNQKPHKQ